jgi:hypothetical protein
MNYRFGVGDEAGQTGFKFESGSTQYFVVTLLFTSDLQTIQTEVAHLHHLLGVSSSLEFKFHSTPRHSRLTFIERAMTLPIAIRSLYVDKHKLPIDFRAMRRWEFYSFFVAQLLSRIPAGELNNTTLIFDEFDKGQTTSTDLRKRLRLLGLWGQHPSLIRRILFRRSHSESAIQVADMLGGAIYRWLTQSDDTYYRLLKSNLLLWEYRGGKT